MEHPCLWPRTAQQIALNSSSDVIAGGVHVCGGLHHPQSCRHACGSLAHRAPVLLPYTFARLLLPLRLSELQA